MGGARATTRTGGNFKYTDYGWENGLVFQKNRRQLGPSEPKSCAEQSFGQGAININGAGSEKKEKKTFLRWYSEGRVGRGGRLSTPETA